MPAPVPTSNFNTEPEYFGIPRNQLFTAVLMEVPFAYLITLFTSGILFVIAAGVLFYYVFMPLAEYMMGVIPPKSAQHYIEWLRAGNTLFITNDSQPLPLSVQPKKEK